MIRRLLPHPPMAVLAATALALGLLGGHAGAQELSGLALGPDGEPLTSTPVVLHRVGAEGGAFVGTDTTSGEGRFSFAVEKTDSSVYFAALRYDDRVYIGPAIQGGGEAESDYILRVDPGSEAGAVASALGGQGPARATARPSSRPAAGSAAARSDAGAFILVGLLAVAAVGAFVTAAPRYRQRTTRQALIELATVENALADPATPEDGTRLLATRDRLRKQLAPGG